jgi:[phosphatase 2A protein]-leucine-carboxy methyltransferase
VRTSAIDFLVFCFVNSRANSNGKKQIISLGAGSDTRVFRLLSENPSLRVVYHELDFPAITSKKIQAIRSSPLLLKALQVSGPDDITISGDGDSLHSPYLHIHPVDLRSLSPSSSVSTLNGVETSLPTLLISECCLVYLSPIDAVNVLSYFTNTLFPPPTISAENSTPLGLILYEPIRPGDPFGKTMVSNLAARGIHLQTLHRYASLDAQRERLREHGFVTGQGAADIDFIWSRWISEEEKERVAGLEMFDEVEEWRLLAAHYCVAWGWREEQGGKRTGENLVFEAWKTLERQ